MIQIWFDFLELCSGDRVASRPLVSDASRPTSIDPSGPTASEPSRPPASKASRPKPSVLFGPMDSCEPISSQQKYLDFELKVKKYSIVFLSILSATDLSLNQYLTLTQVF